VQLDVAASQVASRNYHGALAGARIRQLQPESIDADSGFTVVLRPGTELDARIVWGRQVGVCRSADIADGRTRGRLEIAVAAGAADVQAGEESFRIMVDKIDMAEVTAILAAADETEVGVVAGVGENESATSGEIARGRHQVGFCRGGAESKEDR